MPISPINVYVNDGNGGQTINPALERAAIQQAEDQLGQPESVGSYTPSQEAKDIGVAIVFLAALGQENPSDLQYVVDNASTLTASDVQRRTQTLSPTQGITPQTDRITQTVRAVSPFVSNPATGMFCSALCKATPPPDTAYCQHTVQCYTVVCDMNPRFDINVGDAFSWVDNGGDTSIRCGGETLN